MAIAAAVVANLILLTAALGLGSRLQRFFPQTFNRLDRIALILLGGIGLLGTLLFCLGLLWFSRIAILLVVLPFAALGVKFLAGEVRNLRGLFNAVRPSALPVLIVALVLLVTAVGGLAEPTGDIKLDAIAYHFLGPKVWLRDAVIHPVLDEICTAFPAIVETLFAALNSLGGARAPELFALISLISILLIAAGLALRAGLDARGAWWVAALIITMAPLYRGSYGGFNDVIYSGFVLAAVRVGFDAEHPGHYLLFGTFCGLAMGTKYSGPIAWVLLSVCTFCVAAFVHQLDTKVLLKFFAIACAAAVLVAAPWYLRNWILLGSPIYPPVPFLLRFFSVSHLSPEAVRHVTLQVWKEGTGMGRGFGSFLLLPFNFTLHPANFMNGAGGIGLTPLGFAPFGLLAWRREWLAKGLAFFALLQTITWFVTAQEARYLIHGFVIAAIFAVAGWNYIVHASPKFAPLLCGFLVACSISYGLFMIGVARADDLRAVVSSSFAQERRREEVPFLESFDYLNREPSVFKILVLEPRVPTYYLDKSYLKPIGRWGELSIPEAADQGRVLAELPSLAISHVLDVRFEGNAFRLTRVQKGLELVFEREDQRIYRVK